MNMVQVEINSLQEIEVALRKGPVFTKLARYPEASRLIVRDVRVGEKGVEIQTLEGWQSEYEIVWIERNER